MSKWSITYHAKPHQDADGNAVTDDDGNAVNDDHVTKMGGVDFTHGQPVVLDDAESPVPYMLYSSQNPWFTVELAEGEEHADHPALPSTFAPN